MAGALGDLVIALHADVAKFESDMGRAARVSEREWGRVAGHAASAGRAIAAAAVLAGAAAIKMGHDFIEAASNLDDMAEKTGASVEELSKLEQQAYISGASMETIEMGLVRLTKALHGADEESKGAGKALAALGLSAEKLSKMDTAEALRVVAGELNKYQDGAGKTALALDLFGKSGAQLLPILKDMANDGELNARVTAKQAAEAEELGKSWRRLANDARGVGQAMALEIVPWLQKMIEQFREGIKIAGGFTDALRLFGLSSITSGNAIGKMREINAEIETLTKRRAQFVEQGREGWTKTIDRQIADLKKQREFATILATQVGDKDNFDPSFGGVTPKSKINYTGSTKTGREEADKLAKEMERDRMAQIAQQGRILQADLRAQQYYADEIRKIQEEASKDRDAQIAESGKMIKADLEAQKYYASEIEKYNKQAAEAGKEAATEMSEFWRAAFESMQNAGSDFLFSVLQGEFDGVGRRFKAMLDRMVADYISAQLLMAASKRLGGANDFGPFTNIIGNLANWFTGTQAPAPVSDAIPSLFVGSFADGGTVPRTGLALVHKNEEIIPAGENARGITQIFNITTPDADSFRRTRRQIMSEFAGALG